VGSKKNYASELVTQLALASAAFVIEHPDRAKADAEVYQARLDGSLRAYESIVKAKPKAN